MVHHTTHHTPRPIFRPRFHRTGSWQTLCLTACLLAICTLATAPALAGKTSTKPTTPERQDNVMGTMHEGITMESGSGQDTLIMISPPPQPQQNENNDTLPYGIQPEVKIDPKDYLKKK
jgi:hypothetical protein